jgi:hypothetical protein
MLETEIKQALARYDFLVELLYNINCKTDEALKNDKRWFSFAPKIGIKFLNQAFTLKILFSEKQLELPDGSIKPFEDLSAIYATIRMQFETYTLFHHLFVPCQNIEENILRFRLWELDGIRNRIKINSKKTTDLSESSTEDETYQKVIEQTIINLAYYQNLNDKTQRFLLEKSAWRFTNASLQAKPLRQISYDNLIKMAGVNEKLFNDLYGYLSMHTHPSYIGIVQSFSSTEDETTIGRYIAIMNACFVTSFMIEELSNRFVQGQMHLANLTLYDLGVYISVRDGGRNTSA